LYHLADEEQIATDRGILDRNGRNARTLVKTDTLRVTMIVLAPGGGIAEHHANGPITVHVISGSMNFTVCGNLYTLNAGDLLSVGAGLRHAVSSEPGATFLLTLAGTLG
jgi:quercetin dioxygenase-like cupin family protein